jgi:uncharacterized membrane protein (UPF0136 family)
MLCVRGKCCSLVRSMVLRVGFVLFCLVALSLLLCSSSFVSTLAVLKFASVALVSGMFSGAVCCVSLELLQMNSAPINYAARQRSVEVTVLTGAVTSAKRVSAPTENRTRVNRVSAREREVDGSVRGKRL